MSSQIMGLFPTPFMRVEKLLSDELLRALVAEFSGSARKANNNSLALSHTEIFAEDKNPEVQAVSRLVNPYLVEFGALMFGENLKWFIKEIWANVLETGGQQIMHNHANSFISGVLYLTKPHPSANTSFVRTQGATQFVFSNVHSNVNIGPFNAPRWIGPEANAGDLILFPSYLLHEVPVNQGGRRISVAFNAIPERIDSWGYGIQFSK